MIWFAARTILGGLAAVLAAALIVFVCLMPAGSPRALDPGAMAQAFASFLAGIFTGRLGVSASQSAPVGLLIGGRLAVTLPLIGLGTIVAGLFGSGLGYAATRGNRVVDRALSWLAQALNAVPNFWLGMLLAIAFATILHWLPAGGFVPWTTNPGLSLASLTLPALALGLPFGAALALDVRNQIARTRHAPQIRAARARGMSSKEAFLRHGARNAIVGVLAGAGSIALSLAAGSVIVETVFYLPGLGRLVLDAAGARDAILVRAALLVLILVAVALSVLRRLAVGWIDPRLSGRSRP